MDHFVTSCRDRGPGHRVWAVCGGDGRLTNFGAACVFSLDSCMAEPSSMDTHWIGPHRCLTCPLEGHACNQLAHISLIMPCFASEVRTPTDGHRWCHSPCVFVFVWASESLWVVTPPHLCSHLASGRWFCPQHELGNMLSERT